MKYLAFLLAPAIVFILLPTGGCTSPESAWPDPVDPNAPLPEFDRASLAQASPEVYVLNVDGASINLHPEETQQVTLGGKTMDVTLIPPSVRQFRNLDLEFLYNPDMTFQMTR